MDEGKSDMNLDNIVMLGDPILHKISVAVIKDIIVAGKKEKVLQGEKLHDANISLVIQNINLVLHDIDMLVWNGQYKGDQFTVPGVECNMIMPSLISVEGKSCFAFDRSFIMDIGVQLQQQATEDGEPATKKRKKSDIDKKKCFVCPKSCPLETMRAHVGKHILRKDISGPNICGYCGRGCNTVLEKTHKKRGEWFYRPKSVCPYFMKLRRVPQVSSRINPCTNYIQHCSVCGTCIWKYNLTLHFQEAHQELQAPKLCEKEVKFMMELAEKK